AELLLQLQKKAVAVHPADAYTAHNAAMTVEEMNAEAVLDPAINPQTIPVERVSTPHSIFLTGSSGFVGAFLLRELLKQTEAHIYCLVRAADSEEGRKRIRRNLESYLLWDANLSSRIIPVVGDLAQPLFGLSTQEFSALAEQIDVIYHCGALVKWTYPYSA